MAWFRMMEKSESHMLFILVSSVCIGVCYCVSGGTDALQGVVVPRNKFTVPVVCYYYGWAIARPTPMNYKMENVPLDMCTYVVLAFAGINRKTWELKSIIPTYRRDQSLYKNFTNLKTQHLYLRTMLAVGGWETHGKLFSQMARDPKRRAAFVKSALRWMQDYEFDGLEVIWMYPGYDKRGGIVHDKENFVQLMKELKAAFKPHPLYLTAAVPLGNMYLEQGYDIPRLGENIDWFNVLAFDLRGTWNRFTDVHGILYKRKNDTKYYQELTIEEGMKRLHQLGAPKQKLMLGIAFFGRSYVLRDRKKHGVKSPINYDVRPLKGPFVRSDEVVGYYEICPNVNSGAWHRVFDEEAKCPYVYYSDQWIGYEDGESVGHKMDFIIQGGYRGVMVFNNDLDDFNGVCGPKDPLMTVIFNKVGEKEVQRQKAERMLQLGLNTSEPYTEMTWKLERTAMASQPVTLAESEDLKQCLNTPKVMGPFSVLLCAQLVQPFLTGFALADAGMPTIPQEYGSQAPHPIRNPGMFRPPFRQPFRPPFRPPFRQRFKPPFMSPFKPPSSPFFDVQIPFFFPTTKPPGRSTVQDTSSTQILDITPENPTVNVRTESSTVTTTTTTPSSPPATQTTATPKPLEPVERPETTIENTFISRGGIPVVCYYHGWATTRHSPMNYNIEDIPGDLCTHVNLAYVGIDMDNLDIKSIIPSYKNNTERYRDFGALKNKFLILETMISIGGWDHGGGPFSFVAADASRRQTFANNVLKFLQEYKLDGVDLDWRFPVKESRGGDPEDEENYVQLLRVFHNTLRTKGYTVTATVPITPFYLDDAYNIQEMVKYIDWFNVLGFDLRGRWNGKADVHSPLHRKSTDTADLQMLNIEDGLKWLEELGAPRKKLVVGIPFFGRSFVLANESNHGLGAPTTQAPAAPGTFLGSDEIQAYYEICEKVLDGIATREFDDEGKCPYAYYEDQWIGYEDEESVGMKVDFVIKENYAGVMVFNNDMDDFRGVCGVNNPLLKVIFEKLADAP
ncbi:uncharacterized protein LOC135366324 [Ornithodoros turicata]|uniref:uncharacterized protein LOC135366324 n=1 Tax=Ornithodoros turicata TaxID=34597 RepID=UPI0031395F9C